MLCGLPQITPRTGRGKTGKSRQKWRDDGAGVSYTRGMEDSNDPPVSVPYVSTKWTQSDLMGKSVEFAGYFTGQKVIGIGEFIVDSSEDGSMLAIEILSVNMTRGRLAEQIRVSLDQEQAAKIEIHPEAEKGQSLQPQYRMLAL